MKKNWRKRKIPAWKFRPICAHCGGARPSHRKKYCSQKCVRNAWYHKHKRKVNPLLYCNKCGGHFKGKMGLHVHKAYAHKETGSNPSDKINKTV